MQIPLRVASVQSPMGNTRAGSQNSFEGINAIKVQCERIARVLPRVLVQATYSMKPSHRTPQVCFAPDVVKGPWAERACTVRRESRE
jgi:hypothetical protein